ncbi:MAG: helix-turn-helix transcriptional regulator [Clostridia bacterium]|nr:helix-turn-helix transcriptional regulator [Clostridia bacterium]
MDSLQFTLTTLVCKNYIVEGFLEEDFTRLPRPYYTLCYVQRGRITCTLGEREVVGKAGDVVLFPFHLKYILRWCGEPDTSVYSIHFLLPPMADPFTGKEVPLQRLSGKGMEKEFEYILRHHKDREQSFYVLSLFYGLCHRIYTRLQYAESLPRDERIRKAVEYINLHAAEPLTVETLAALCFMSPSRFFYCFKKETGQTPIEYKNHLCIRRGAALLLVDPHRSVEQISSEVGFSSATYFRRLFKHTYDYTPREYRKAMRSDF